MPVDGALEFFQESAADTALPARHRRADPQGGHASGCSFLINVGPGVSDAGPLGGDAVGRRGAADPAGDPDRLAAGGRAVHPGRAVHRAAPARQPAAAGHAGAAARPRQHRPGGGARRGDDPRRGSHRWISAPARGGTAARWSPRGRWRMCSRHADSLTGAYLRGDRAIEIPAERRAPQPGHELVIERRARAQPAQRHRRASRSARFVAVTGVSGSGKSHADQRHPLEVAGRAASTGRRWSPACTMRITRAGSDRQGGGHRPVADRADAAVESRDVHRSLHHHPRALRGAAGEQDARVLARALLLQREGRALRGVPGRRAGEDRDALPSGRLRAVRGVQGEAIQPRDARGLLQGPLHR